jgi:hypothetical protein
MSFFLISYLKAILFKRFNIFLTFSENILFAKNPEAFYMIYAVNKDEQLDLQEHYPSLAFTL